MSDPQYFARLAEVVRHAFENLAAVEGGAPDDYGAVVVVYNGAVMERTQGERFGVGVVTDFGENTTMQAMILAKALDATLHQDPAAQYEFPADAVEIPGEPRA